LFPLLHGYKGGQDFWSPSGAPIVTEPVPAIPVRLVRFLPSAAAWMQSCGLVSQPDGAATKFGAFGSIPYTLAEVTKRRAQTFRASFASRVNEGVRVSDPKF